MAQTDMFDLNVDPNLMSFIDQIKHAYDVGLYFPALFLTLAVPDICSSLPLKSEDARHGIGKRYVDWCESYLERVHDRLSSEHIWAFRNGVLHDGRLDGRTGMPAPRIAFTIPGPLAGFGAHIESMEGDPKMHFIDLNGFIRSMARAVEAWWRDHEKNERVLEALPTIMQVRGDGFFPGFMGIEAIA